MIEDPEAATPLITRQDLADALQPEPAFQAAQAQRPHLTRLYLKGAEMALSSRTKGRE